jgi:hypothetical protein
MSARTAQWARVLDAANADLIAKSRTNAQAFADMGHTFSADLANNFAAELEAGAPAGMYRHWITEQGQRVQDIRGRDAAMMRARGMR